jgi:polysaccharide biosynthesis transport protein
MTTINPTRPALSPAARPGPAPSAAGPGVVPAIDPLKLLQKYKWILGIAAAVGVTLGTVGHFVLLYTFPIYSTSVIYECFPVETNIETIGGGHGAAKDALQSFMATEVQVLLSDRTVDRAVQDPMLQTEAPKWTSQFRARGAFDTVAAARDLRRKLSAGSLGQSNFVRMSLWWTDPDEVAAIARVIARNYESDRNLAANREISQRKDNLLAQSNAAGESIQQLQRNRDRLLHNRNVDTLDAARSNANRQMETASAYLSQARMSRESLQVQKAQLMQELSSPVGINFSDTIRKRVDDDPEIAAQKNAINMLEARHTAMGQRLGPDHRSRSQLRQEIEGKRLVLAETTERLLRKAFDAELDGIRTAIRSLEAQELDQLTALEEARQKQIELTQIISQVKDIDREIERLNMTRANFNDALKNLEVTTAGRGQSRIMLYQDAQRPREVRFPKLYLLAPAGLILALGLVGGLILLVEVIDQRVKSPADIAMIPRTRVLGLVAHASEDPANPAKIETVFRDQPGGVLAEHYRQLRGSVLKRMQQGGHKSLVVMSGMPGSGATTIVANLALALAAAEHRVLLVDANFRRPGLHRVLGVSEGPGLADVLAGSRPLQDSIQHTENDRLHVLTAGSPDNRMFERLGTQAMGDLLRESAGQYDIVLIDVAPAMVSGDALSVANRADASLLVVRAMGEKRGMVARLRNELDDARADFLGVLVNAARSSAGGYLRGNILATHQYRAQKGE